MNRHNVRSFALKGALHFALIGNPVAHSLSPAMHNALYAALAAKDSRFEGWRYEAILCKDDDSARAVCECVRTGDIAGMNITTPYKGLAAGMADSLDEYTRAARGANVLLCHDGKLCAYNTDGQGALRAVSRGLKQQVRGARVIVCGTGPTSCVIAVAFAAAQAARVDLFSRSLERAAKTVARLQSLSSEDASVLQAADYSSASRLVPLADIVIDATVRGMKPGDAAIVDTKLFHEGQFVLDTVYAHGKTALLTGAASAGASVADGREMLVEQAALSEELWFDALGIKAQVNRKIMRKATLQ